MAAYTTIDDPTLYFNTITYVANETDDRAVTVGFQPDFVWLKDRDQAVNHDLYDSIRGATKYISSNNNNAEATQSDGLKSFTSTGFTLGTGWGNQSTNDDYVAWCWKESATSGFDIVSYTGNATARTISHSLSAVPKVIIIKDISTSGEWVFGHASLGFTKFIEMNSTGAAQTVTSRFNDTAPTSSVFTVGTANDTNENTDSLIAYLFAEKQGFSKFGSYTGNGNADGPFIFTGFRPAFVLQKNAGATQGWQLQDNKREGYNGDNDLLQPHDNATESGVNRVDLLSNGFKVITTDAGQNSSGTEYIYMAFAEQPFVNSEGVPCNAR
jgi:hypothetical protein